MSAWWRATRSIIRLETPFVNEHPRRLETYNAAHHGHLFIPAATFGVSSEWGSGARIWFRGREQLRVAGGGGTDACRPPQHPAHYLVISPVINARARRREGEVNGCSRSRTKRPSRAISFTGKALRRYVREDASGWRFKSRVHVWPEIRWTDNPADMPPRDLEQE